MLWFHFVLNWFFVEPQLLWLCCSVFNHKNVCWSFKKGISSTGSKQDESDFFTIGVVLLVVSTFLWQHLSLQPAFLENLLQLVVGS